MGHGSTPRRVHVVTWGCQMNVYDSERLQDVLLAAGWGAAEHAAEADLVILNTCHIRERATEKLFSELGRLRRLKEGRRARGEEMQLVVAGCVAQAEGKEILARAPFVDVVLGPQTIHRLPGLIARAEREGPVVDTEFPVEPKFDFLPEARAASGGAVAFLAIQEGCDKFCSFCVVPYTRGAEMSRPAAAVLAEARRLAERGAREVTLLGQNVNAWRGAAPHGGHSSLAELLRALSEIPGIARLRYTTSHPLDMDEALIAAHRDNPVLMPFLHLPVQSGSDAVLKRMRRRHRAADYLRIIERLRAARPDIALSSDFIVGHPGETEVDFEATMKLAGEVGFAQAFSFKYSPRPGTPAADAPDQVPEAEKKARLAALQALLRQQQLRFNHAMVGRRMSVLFAGAGRKPGQVVGRSPYLQPVHVGAPARGALDGGASARGASEGASALIGQIREVRILEALPNSLAATLDVEEPAVA
ncbi:MAG: tRNA (N6-isopentenyl adenosine(37)-C2)-methylthiotransferase MiaB [Acetobacteraceae bacterium]